MYDLLGNEVATIFDKELLPGSYEIEFGAMIDKRQLVNGIYFYQLRAGGFVQTKKKILMRYLSYYVICSTTHFTENKPF